MNPWTEKLKEGMDTIEEVDQMANDALDVRDAFNDSDPAAGLDVLDKSLDYTVGKTPGIGSALKEIFSKAIETVKTAPGGVAAAHDTAAEGTINYGAQGQMQYLLQSGEGIR